MFRSSLAIVVLILAALGLTRRPTAAQDKKDPQSSFEPRSKPGVGQKFLEKFVGTWDVVKSFHPRTGEPFRVKGECVQSMMHEGRFLKSDFVFGQGDAKTTGTGLVGFESETGLFTSAWIDSRATKMSHQQSKDKFNGNEIVLFGKTFGTTDPRISRTITRLEDDGRKIVHRQHSLTPDGKERLVMELVMTRKNAK
jgi:hypothetical protein